MWKGQAISKKIDLFIRFLSNSWTERLGNRSIHLMLNLMLSWSGSILLTIRSIPRGNFSLSHTIDDIFLQTYSCSLLSDISSFKVMYDRE